MVRALRDPRTPRRLAVALLVLLVGMSTLLAALVGLDRVLELAIGTAARSATPTLGASGPAAASGSSDSASPTPNARLLTPAELWSELDRLGTAQTTGGPVSLAINDLGALVLPSGRIVAGDAFLVAGAPALTRTVPPGDYVVSIALAATPTDARVAAAIVRFGAGTPASWALATVPGQDATSLAPDQFLGYAVDSGTGAFTSPEAARLVPVSSDPAQDPILQQLAQTEVATWATANVVLDPASGANLIAFTSGFGDGDYPSYWGLDASGQPLVLVTDFGVLDAPIGGASPAISTSP